VTVMNLNKFSSKQMNLLTFADGAFARLKKRAENQGQTVTVTEDGILTIDDVAVYCMKQGYVGQRTVAHLDG